MWPYLPELLARPVPRYTSFPTAAEFSDAVGASSLEAELDALADGTPASLYVHIPYCHEICWYCGCNTGAANRTVRLSAYLDALHAEIDLVARKLGGRARIERIAFGGGSPNAITPEQFEDLLARIKAAFGADAPLISIELDPRSHTSEWMPVLARAGVRRASLGVQTLSDSVQRAIGRVQPLEMIETVTADLRHAGIDSLNLDLMYGLPGQGVAELGDTLRLAARLAPDRLAVFGYAHVPHLIPRQRQIDGTHLPDQATRFRQAEFAYQWLLSGGYDPVGFDHFATPGDPMAQAVREGRLRRNFQGFTDDDAEVLIGLGASAISQFPALLAQNEKSAGPYRKRVQAGELAVERGIARSGEDQARGRIIEGLLCLGEAMAPPELYPQAYAALDPFAAQGLIERDGDRLSIPSHAIAYARSIAACFDPYRAVDPRRFSSAV